MKLAKMFLSISASLLAGALPANAARYMASGVMFDGITADVRVITTEGTQVEVNLQQGRVYQPIRVELKNGVLVLTGEGLPNEPTDYCCKRRIQRTVHLAEDRDFGHGERGPDAYFSDYPVIEVSAPRRTDLTFSNAKLKLSLDDLDGDLSLEAVYVYGETGDLAHAVVDVLAGSRLVLGDVKSALELNMAGDAAVVAGDVAMIDIDMAGAGDLTIASVIGMTDVSLAGSGDVRLARVEGPLTIRIAGSGVVSVQSGRSDVLHAFIDGSGELFFQGIAASADLRLNGSAKVWLGAVSGPIRSHGQGRVYVNGVPHTNR